MAGRFSTRIEYVRIPIRPIPINQTEMASNIKRMNLVGDVSYAHGGLKISGQLVESWIKEPISNAISHMSGILTEPSMSVVDSVLLVGGFAECPFVQEAVKKAFSNKRIVIPSQPREAVLCGAVLFGRQFTAM